MAGPNHNVMTKGVRRYGYTKSITRSSCTEAARTSHRSCGPGATISKEGDKGSGAALPPLRLQRRSVWKRQAVNWQATNAQPCSLFQLVFIGVGGTLAWQYYGGEAVRTWAPSLSSLLPASTMEPPAPTVTSTELKQQLKPMAIDLALVRRSEEQLAANQDTASKTRWRRPSRRCRLPSKRSVRKFRLRHHCRQHRSRYTFPPNRHNRQHSKSARVKKLGRVAKRYHPLAEDGRVMRPFAKTAIAGRLYLGDCLVRPPQSSA